MTFTDQANPYQFQMPRVHLPDPPQKVSDSITINRDTPSMYRRHQNQKQMCPQTRYEYRPLINTHKNSPPNTPNNWLPKDITPNWIRAQTRPLISGSHKYFKKSPAKLPLSLINLTPKLPAFSTPRYYPTRYGTTNIRWIPSRYCKRNQIRYTISESLVRFT